MRKKRKKEEEDQSKDKKEEEHEGGRQEPEQSPLQRARAGAGDRGMRPKTMTWMS